RAAGLAAGPMTGFDADAVTKEFFPDGRHRVMVAINIGEPAENAWMGRLPRLEYDEVVETLWPPGRPARTRTEPDAAHDRTRIGHTAGAGAAIWRVGDARRTTRRDFA